jgi:hypothetical protein
MLKCTMCGYSMLLVSISHLALLSPRSDGTQYEFIIVVDYGPGVN